MTKDAFWKVQTSDRQGRTRHEIFLWLGGSLETTCKRGSSGTLHRVESWAVVVVYVMAGLAYLPQTLAIHCIHVYRKQYGSYAQQFVTDQLPDPKPLHPFAESNSREVHRSSDLSKAIIRYVRCILVTRTTKASIPLS